MSNRNRTGQAEFTMTDIENAQHTITVESSYSELGYVVKLETNSHLTGINGKSAWLTSAQARDLAAALIVYADGADCKNQR